MTEPTQLYTEYTIVFLLQWSANVTAMQTGSLSQFEAKCPCLTIIVYGIATANNGICLKLRLFKCLKPQQCIFDNKPTNAQTLPEIVHFCMAHF